MRRKNLDLWITAALAVLTSLAAFTKLPSVVMFAPGLALIAAPGFVWCEALLGPRAMNLERAAVAGAFALAVPVLGGLVLNASGISLSSVSWVGLLALATLIGDVVVYMQRRSRRTPLTDRIGPAEQPRPDDRAEPAGPPVAEPHKRRASRWSIASLCAAIVVAGCGVGLAHAGAERQQYPGFTQLWLVADKAGPPRASLGVTNQQASMHYQIVVVRQGYAPLIWDFVLRTGQSWHRTVTFGTSNAISATLYRLPDLTHIYRYVTLNKSGTSP